MNRTNLAVLALALALAALALQPALARAQTDTTTTTSATATTSGGADATATTSVTTEPAAATATTSVTTEPAASTFDEPEPVAEAAPVSPPVFLLSIRVGAFVPQVFNRLDASFTVSLGIGYVLPFLDYRVAIVVDGFYTRPERSETLMDPRLPAPSTYRYGLVQNDISLFAGFLVHFTDLARETFVPYAGLGARVHFLWTEIDGSSGATTNTTGFHRETSTQGGGAVRLGLGIRVGPGLIALDAELSLAPLDHLITGGANIGALGIAAGYTFVF